MFPFTKRKKQAGEKALQQTIEGMDVHYAKEEVPPKLAGAKNKLSHKALYAAFVLTEALKSPALPKKTKMTIIGALGYLLLPADLAADILPGIGLVDDAAVILAALATVYVHVDEPMKQKAHAKMKKWFGSKYSSREVNEEIHESLK